jgi:hypothetical protein
MRNEKCVMVEATEDHPDALLIAAAPDLLAACKAALECDEFASLFNGASMGYDLREKLRAAIARAEAPQQEPTHE